MVEIFIIQFVAAALGAASTAMADWMYRSGGIRRHLHSFWVAASIAGICLPVLIWTCNVFLGLELPGQLVIAVLVGTTFVCIYRDLQKSPSVQNLDGPLPQHPLESCRSSNLPAQRLRAALPKPQHCVNERRARITSLRQHAQPLTSSAFQGGRWFCLPLPAPRRD